MGIRRVAGLAWNRLLMRVDNRKYYFTALSCTHPSSCTPYYFIIIFSLLLLFHSPLLHRSLTLYAVCLVFSLLLFHSPLLHISLTLYAYFLFLTCICWTLWTRWRIACSFEVVFDKEIRSHTFGELASRWKRRMWQECLNMARYYILCTAGGCRKHNFWTTPVKSIKKFKFGILTSRAIDWYIYGSNWGGGVPQRVFSFFAGGSSFFLGHIHGILNIP